MCGRFALTTEPDKIKAIFDLNELAAFPPRYNIGPTQPILTIKSGVRAQYDAMLVRWGLVPSWVKDPNDFSLLVNARSESAHEKPSFRNAMRHSRVIIPASGWYEWHRQDGHKQPYHIRLKSGEPVLMGGLMETWSDPNGSEVDTGCVLTTPASDALRHVHHRMPVIIKEQDIERWLDCKTQEPRHIADLLVPQDQLEFEAIAVNDAVNSVRNDDPSVQAPKRLDELASSKPKAKTKPADDQLDLF